MAGIGVKNRWHILRDNPRGDGTGVPVGAGLYTTEAIKDGLLFTNQAGVDSYVVARGGMAGEYVFIALP